MMHLGYEFTPRAKLWPDSESPGSPLSPLPATIKAFSWHDFTNLPYSYPLDDPAELEEIVTGNSGAYAGELTWPKTNWLRTYY